MNQNGIFLLGPTIMEVGTDEQKARFLPTMASSEIVWAQAWSEPQRRLRPRRHPRHRRAQRRRHRVGAQRAEDLGVTRRSGPTGASASSAPIPKPNATAVSPSSWCRSTRPGVTVRPIAQLDGDTGFAEIFFDDVRVPVENTLGEVNQGWRVAMATAGFERGVSLRSPARFSAAADRLVALWREHADPSDTALRDAVADAWMQAEGYKLHTYMTVTHMIDGGTHRRRGEPQQDLLERDGRAHPRARARHRAEPTPSAWTDAFERWVDGFLFSLSGPIYAGTNEIQRNIIADRVLQLPRGA